jgi:hypothetical protein
MKFSLEAFTRLNGQTHLDERPVLHVWSTHASESPWFVEIDALHAPITVYVPSTDSYDALIIEMLVDVVTDEDRVVRGHAGRAVLNHDTCKTGQVKLLNDTRSRPTAWLKFSTDVLPKVDGVDPDCNAAAAMCDALVERTSAWYEDGRPIDKEIERVHIPRLPGIFKNAPGFIFAAHRPCEPEDDELFERVVLAAAARRGENAHEIAVKVISEINVPSAEPSDIVRKMAVYLAEGVQLLVNNLPYLADPEVNGDKVTTIDRFSTDVRVSQAGDCEDCAREIALLWTLARKCKGTTPLVRAIALVARCYVACEHLGAVSLRGSPFLAVYSTGGSYFAHAFAQIIPTHWFKAAMYNDDSFTKMQLAPNMLCPWDHGLRTLTLDGVRLCDADAFSPSFPYKQLTNDLSGSQDADELCSRLKCVEKVGTKHYVYVSSSYVFGDFTTSNHCPVYEVGYKQPDGAYGTRFQQMFDMSPEVRVFCTHGDKSCADDAHAVADSYCLFLHPVPAWNTTGAPTDEDLTRVATRRLREAGLEVSEGPRGDAAPHRASHAVLGPCEFGNDSYVHSLARAVAAQGFKSCRVQPERLARGASGVSLYAWK